MLEPIKREFIRLRDYSLLQLYHSLNNPTVSLSEGMPPEAASASLVVLLNRSKAVEIFAGLFFSGSNRRVLYRMEPFQIELLADKLTQAQDYVEQMGFILDNSNFEKLAQEEKASLIRTVPFFYEDIQLFYEALSSTEIKFRKAVGAVHEAAGDQQKIFLEQYLKVVSML